MFIFYINLEMIDYSKLHIHGIPRFPRLVEFKTIIKVDNLLIEKKSNKNGLGISTG